MSNVPNQQQQVNLQVRYDDMNARYANQVLLNTTAEECYLDFSPGVVMNGAAGGGPVLPIHTRIVMTPTGMLRLYQAIGQALQNYQIVQNNPAPAPQTPQSVGGSEPETDSGSSAS
jgi:uncharacterized protein DUF3467